MIQVSDEKIPLRVDKSGNVYVGETRVSLDCLVEMFDQGASPEEIAAEYDSVALADVYAVLTYYLRHQDDVKAYLAKQATGSEEARKPLNAVFPNHLREKLLRAKRERDAGGDQAAP